MSSQNGVLPRSARYGVVVMLVRSVIMLLAGIYGLADPQGALRLIVVISAILLTSDGVLGLLGAIVGTGNREPGFIGVASDLVSVIFGLIIFMSPYLTSVFAANFIITIIGTLAIAAGVFELYLAFKFRDLVTQRWPPVLLAIAHVGLGVMLLIAPYHSALVVIRMGSILLILYGCALLAVSWHTQHQMRVRVS